MRYDLTDKQKKALEIMGERYKAKSPLTVITGYAGSGKSTIIAQFIRDNNLHDTTSFATFTGKASLILQKQGLPATTIHSLVYNAYRDYKTGRFYFRKKPELDKLTDLIIVDEISMVPEDLLNDLLSFNVPIIALGDPFQLEPVGKDNGIMEKPHFFLDEIHRQEENSMIVKVSKMIRQGAPLDNIEDNKEVKIIYRDSLTPPMLSWADQIICGKNSTRLKINEEIRARLGFTKETPEVGDKMICLRNYWDTLNEDGFPLINGTLGTVKQISEGGRYGILGQRLSMDFLPDYSDFPFEHLILDSNIFFNYAPSEYKKNSKNRLYEFDFGYAITCHKSQGSQFDKVLVYEERLGSDNYSHARWLYTAITRAKSKLVLVRERS